MKLIYEICVVIFCLLFLVSCEDVLPTGTEEPPVIERNPTSFYLTGNGFSNLLVNMSNEAANAYFFASDTMVSVWKSDRISLDSNVMMDVVLVIDIPASKDSIFSWPSALENPSVKTKLVLNLNGEKYYSVEGKTTVKGYNIGVAERIEGSYSGKILSVAGKVLYVLDGHFYGLFF